MSCQPCGTLFADSKYQQFPDSRRLGRRLDWPLPKFKSLVRDLPGEVFSYVVRTVKRDGDDFRQMGSAPNFQGSYITLCTCKHQMRTRREVEDWPGNWIAGFTSRTHDGNHWLVYLARVGAAHETHADLWYSGDVPARTLKAKSASRHRLGDVYEPKSRGAGFSPAGYHRPVKNHVHRWQWHGDINYRLADLERKPKRPAALLVCDPKFSFIWTQPIIRFRTDHARDYLSWGSVSEFIGQLR